MKNRYEINGNIEGQFEPGSNGKVLANKLGIKDAEEISRLELENLERVEVKALIELTDDFQFTADYFYELHREWLGDIYEWAGKPRTVNISKHGITYCAPEFIEANMNKLEKQTLTKNTPCTFDSIEEIATAMAEVHGEFEIIHPFREGNGRLGRLIVSLMANQSGFAVEKLGEHIQKNWEKYIAGLKESWKMQYKTLTGLFKEILEMEKP